MPHSKIYRTIATACFIATAYAQTTVPEVGPTAYPGMPSTPYGPEWQSYFHVASWPNVTFPVPTSYAGSVSVNRSGHANNTLFFVAFEKEGGNGSLTAAEGQREGEPWVIWLNGGPGSSSMFGLFGENGPIRYSAGHYIGPNVPAEPGTLSPNPYSWHNLSDIFYVDQPVGTGYSTIDETGWAADEDVVGQDFVQFPLNIVEIFPSLKKRPLYLTGESYAGTYIPYISKAVFQTVPPPVNLVKFAIGDGTMGTDSVFTEYSTLQIMQTYPQLIGFNTTIYEYFVEQYNLCGYNLTLQYPAPSDYPTIHTPLDFTLTVGLETRRQYLKHVLDLYTSNGRELPKRQSSSQDRPSFALTGTIDPSYSCDVWTQLLQFAMEYTAPWQSNSIDVYSLADALGPEASSDASAYLNDPAVRQALHAPQKTWVQSVPYQFGAGANIDPSPPPQVFLSELSKNITMVFYSGNDDALVAHRGTELTIQNTTFGGIRGFMAHPSTPFVDTDGKFAGIIHQERNMTYALFNGAGHMVPADKPKSAYAFIKEFVLGNNQTGLLTTANGQTSVVGGVHTEYLKGILTASEVFTGSFVTEGTVTWPQASFDMWGSYMATRTAADAPVASAIGDGGMTISTNNGAGQLWKSENRRAVWVLIAVVFLAVY